MSIDDILYIQQEYIKKHSCKETKTNKEKCMVKLIYLHLLSRD